MALIIEIVIPGEKERRRNRIWSTWEEREESWVVVLSAIWSQLINLCHEIISVQVQTQSVN